MERRNTKQRTIILDAVRSRCDHPTAEEIWEQVKKSDPRISLGTVYRNLAVLADEGQVLDIRLSCSDRFDLRTDCHSHFLCECCGKVFDIPDSLPASSDSIEGFLITERQTVYKGICPGCRKTAK